MCIYITDEYLNYLIVHPIVCSRIILWITCCLK